MPKRKVGAAANKRHILDCITSGVSVQFPLSTVSLKGLEVIVRTACRHRVPITVTHIQPESLPGVTAAIRKERYPFEGGVTLELQDV